MDLVELRQHLGCILDKEERAISLEDWAEVERLTDELQARLEVDPSAESPEIVNHYLDDVDIRARDERYAVQQRQQVRLFVETGEYYDGTPVPLWACAMLAVALVGLFLWAVV